jgi:hypothetical protein
MSLRAAAIATTIALAVLATVATGATKTIHDPTGDLTSAILPGGVKAADVDIIKATTGKAGTQIEMTMTVDGAIGKAINHADTPPEFFVKTGGPTFYGVYPTSGEVVDLTHGGAPKNAKMTKLNSHALSVTFKPKAIGSPSGYHWYAVTGDCAVYDRAPDTGFVSNKSAKRC